VYRPAYALLVGVATLTGLLAVVAAITLDRKLVDPEGFLGPAAVRLPLLVLGAFLLDMLPRTLWVSRMNLKLMPDIVKNRVRDHWTRERMILVVMGLVCFYITYVSYRNLKSFLPFIMGEEKYDRELHLMDRALFLGHEPATVLHTIFGTGPIAHVLSSVYLWFLPLVPLALAAWLVWSRNITFGYWFATSQCLAWTLGTASYYALPTLGPGFQYSFLYQDLPDTGSGALMDSLFYARKGVLRDGIEGAVQSVAGFASLHVAITLLVALMVQYTLRSRVIQIVFWVNFAITVIATLYFGWHYVADDIAGVAIALVSFWLGGLASGQKFDRGGLASHPTSTTSKVPVDAD
jgi:hypothetical protein